MTIPNLLWANIGITALQIVLVIVLFTGLGALVRFAIVRLDKVPALEKRRHTVNQLQKTLQLLVKGAGVLLAAAILALNIYLILRQESLLGYYSSLLTDIRPDFWRQLGIGFLLTAGEIIAAIYAIRAICSLLVVLERRAKEYEQIRANDESIERFFSSLTRIVSVGIWLLVIALVAGNLQLPSSLTAGLFILLRVYLIISFGLLIIQAVAAIVDSLDALSRKYARTDSLLHYYEQLKGLIPLLRRTLEYIIYVSVASLVLLQIDWVAQFAEWGPRLVQVLGIFFIARVVIEVVNLLIERAMKAPDDVAPEQMQRQLTLVPLIKSLLKYAVYFGAFVLVLNALTLNPAPILAGAGIVTIVVGLGAQPLINDIVSGFFILFENLYLVGDYIETGTARGTVEAIDIRTTRIRDPNGQQHILRNGQLGEVINFSKGYTYAVVAVGVAYNSNLDHVYEVLRQVGRELAETHADVIEPTEIQGLENFGASELVIRTVTRVKPGRHLQIARELRKLIKNAFDLEGIEIPFTQQVLHFHPSNYEQFMSTLTQANHADGQPLPQLDSATSS